jgi:predicted site-specific integrase-resolvase
LVNTLLKNTEIKELYNNNKSPEEVVNDLIEIITVFSSRVYGLRSYKNSLITNQSKIISKISNLSFIHF